MDTAPEIPPAWIPYLLELSQRDHIAIDRTAALIHGVDAFAWAELDLPLVPETAVLAGRRSTRLSGVHGCERSLSDMDVMRLGGIPVTTPLRTAMDLGCILRRWQAYAAMNALARAHEFGRADMVAQFGRYRGRRGVRQLRELAGHLEPQAESPRESRVLLAIIDAGLPLPTPQADVTVRSGDGFRLDFAYVRRRLAVEYDGQEYHATEEQNLRDRRRRDQLRREGWTIVVLTSADFQGPTAGAWINRLREHLTEPVTNRRW